MKVKIIKTTESPLPSKSLNQGIKKKNKKKKNLQNSTSIVKAVKESTIEVQPTAITKKKKNKKKKSVNDHSDVESKEKNECATGTDDVTNSSKITTTDNGAIKKKSEEDSSLNTKPNTKQTKGTKQTKKDLKKNKNVKEVIKKNKNLKEHNQEQEIRTVFVGNVSIKTTRLDLSRFFSKYGKVETVRLRSAAVASPEMSKKESVNTGKFHEKRTSINGYVRFTQKEMVEEAITANGVELMGKHLNVDKVVDGRCFNEKFSVFVGNLSFEAEDELLRAHFSECGEIESVRIIRSRKLGSGKGFGYVNFKSADSVEIALRLHNARFMHRQLRVQRCEKKPKKVKAPKKVVKKVAGKTGLGFLKPNKDKKKKQTKKIAGGNFSGVKMVETKKFKKMKKGKLTKTEWKKKAIAHQLTGAKPKVKKAT